MIITEIKVTKAGRFFLMSGEMGLFSLHPDIYEMEQISAGMDIPVEQLEQLRLRDAAYSAKQKAFDYLAAADQTSGMLKRKLSRYYEAEAVEQAVSRMEELHLVDDEDYAMRAARDMLRLRRYSFAHIRAELRKRGLDAEHINAALEQFSEEDETEAAAGIISKQYREKISDSDGRRKVIAALQRRGFSYETIRKALDSVSEGLEEDFPE